MNWLCVTLMLCAFSPLDTMTYENNDEFIEHLTPLYNKIEELKQNGWYIKSEFEINLNPYFGNSITKGFIDILGFKENAIMVVDFKYGNCFVNVDGNRQLLIYCLGAIVPYIEKYGYIPENFITIIVQPKIKSNSWSERILSYSKVEKYINSIRHALIKCFENSLGANHEKKPSLASCSQCNNNLFCEEKYTEVDGIVDKFLSFNKEIKNDALADLMTNSPFIKKAMSDAEELARIRCLRGETIEGFKVIKGRKYRSWIGKKDDMIEYSATIGIDNVTKETLITPAAMERKDLTDLQLQLIKQMVKYDQSPDKLTLNGDSRKSVQETVSCAFDDYIYNKEK